MPNLLLIERVCLFGVVFKGFSADGKVPDASKQEGGSIHPSSAIKDALKNRTGLAPKLARIYAITYEGGYYILPRPTVFLVHGDGQDPETVDEHGNPVFHLDNVTPPPGTTGLPSKDGTFAEDVKVWTYDREDMTVRVEIATGALDELLLEPLFCPGGGASRADMTSRADLTSRRRSHVAGGSDVARRPHLTR